MPSGFLDGNSASPEQTGRHLKRIASRSLYKKACFLPLAASLALLSLQRGDPMRKTTWNYSKPVTSFK